MRPLERDGFVDNVPGRGSTISHITPLDIREIFEIREIIETGAAKHAAQVQPHDEAVIKKRAEHQHLLRDGPESEMIGKMIQGSNPLMIGKVWISVRIRREQSCGATPWSMGCCIRR